MLNQTLTVVFGGTFDPVHHGHLRMAVELRDRLQVQVRLVPCAQPGHRSQPHASASERLAMLKLAVDDEVGLLVDDREIRRGGTTYTVDTLRELRQELGEAAPLAIVVGMDAFNGLPSWHHWVEIPHLAHIIVVCRPDWSLSNHLGMQEFLTKRQAPNHQALTQQPAGLVLPLELSRLEISSSAIRDDISHQRSPRYLVPDAVWNYIQAQGLYRQARGVHV